MALAKDGDRKQVSSILTKELHRQLQEEADNKTLTVSTLIRMILKEHFDTQKK